MLKFIVLSVLSSTALAQTPIQIVWHKTDTAIGDCMRHQAAMTPRLPRLFYKPIYGKDFERLGEGCVIMDKGVCHVYAKDSPVIDGRFEKDQWAVLGHEVKHCFDGNFHK